MELFAINQLQSRKVVPDCIKEHTQQNTLNSGKVNSLEKQKKSVKC